MVFGRKKKKKEEEETQEEETSEEELPKQPKKEVKKRDAEEKKIDKLIKEQQGQFSLDENEMALAVNALASSEEFKIYQQMVIGQQIAKIIKDYNEVIRGRGSEEQEEELPTE